MAATVTIARRDSGTGGRPWAPPAPLLVVGSAAALLTFGLLMVYSATSIYVDGGTAFLKRSVVWAAIGLAAFWGVRRIDYHLWVSHARLLAAAALVLLGGVLIPGVGSQVNGARRWYRAEFFSFQPSEALKWVIPLYLADVLVRKRPLRDDFLRGGLPLLLFLGASVGLLILEPDFGTSVLATAVAAMLLVAGGARARHIGILAALAVPVFAIALVSSPYRLQRLTTFLHPWDDPQGKGYQVIQSQVAMGSGGLFGKGIGAGQQKLHYVPSIYADFILAQVGEETGLAGVTTLFGLFAALLWGCWRVARDAPDAAGAYVALGVLFIFGVQAAINAAVVTGLAPTKGIPLPLVSFGGSSLLFSLASLGVVMNVADQAAGRRTAPGAP